MRATTRGAATVLREWAGAWFCAWWHWQRRVGRDGTEFDVERYFRDAPLMIVGEGTNDIQRNVIARQLVARGGVG